ncbi:MAG: hypothetical protein KC421_22155 [Anaerolineales bacterium]|nr:hypothetical protein [Anaerolineales bacterium]
MAAAQKVTGEKQSSSKPKTAVSPAEPMELLRQRAGFVLSWQFWTLSVYVPK